MAVPTARSTRKLIRNLTQGRGEGDRLRRPVHRAERGLADDGRQRARSRRCQGQPRTVMATTDVDSQDGNDARSSAAAGPALQPRDPGELATTRTTPTDASATCAFRSTALETFPIAAARPSRGTWPCRHGNSAWIDFRGTRRAVRRLSFSDVYTGKFTRPPPSRASSSWSAPRAASLQDVHPTSTTGDGTDGGRGDPGERDRHRARRASRCAARRLARRRC